MARPPLSLAVVGADYPNKRGPTRRFAIELLAPGDPVELRPEPKNPADPNAIAVISAQGVQMGYLTAERAPWIGKLMGEHEVIAVFQDRTRGGAIVRVSFDGSPPALPPPLPAEQGEPEFYPDEIYPDE